MSYPLVYLINRFRYRLVEFLKHWYVNAFLIISHRTVSFLERLDRTLALKITFRNFFRPLYQDYTLLGYLLGFFFRFWRILFASLVYLVVIIVALFIYAGWAAMPVYIIYKGLYAER